MAGKRWEDINPKMRRTIMVVSAVDLALKAVALVDLVRRPQEEVNGSKRVWALSLAFVNSAGVLPVVYLVKGRKPGGEAEEAQEPSDLEEPTVVVVSTEPAPQDVP